MALAGAAGWRKKVPIPTPARVAATATVGTPTITRTALAQPARVAAIATVGAAQGPGSAQVQPARVQAIAAVGAVTVTNAPVAAQREVLSGSSISAVTLTTGAGTQVGDQLVCIRMTDAFTDSNILTAPTGTTGVWEQRGTDIAATDSAPRVRVWTRTVATAGAQTVTCGATAKANHVVLYVLPTGRAVNSVQTSFGTGTGTTRVAPSATAPTANTNLICCGAEYDAPDFTAFGTLTLDAEIASNASAAWAGHETVPAGTTGTRSVTKASGSNWWVTATIAAGIGSAPPPDDGLTLQPMQPMTFVYDTVTSTMDSYETPGALVVAGRSNYGDQRFIDVANAGGTVLIYFDAIVHNTTGTYHAALFNSSAYGAAVPKWPGPVSANATGDLADFRVGGVLQGKLEAVLEQIVADNPHMGGFFADDCGSRSYFPNFEWSTFGTTNQNDYRAGQIAVAQAFRNVCDNHGLMLLVNGTWNGGTVAALGGGYPTLGTNGCSLADGGVVEHHDTADAFWQGYLSSAQWATDSPLTNGDAAHVVIGTVDSERAQWAALGTAAFYVNQTAYSSAVAPWGSFHATGLPAGGTVVSTEYRLWPATNGPGAQEVDASDYTLGVEFSADSAATITGIRFWASGTVTSSNHATRLYSVNSGGASGSLVSGTSIAFPSPLVNGWNTATFAAPVTLTPNQKYRACVYFTTNNGYTATGNYWTTGAGGSGITNGPLAGTGTGFTEGGDQCSFLAGSDGFPTSSFNGGNYWIDPVVVVKHLVPFGGNGWDALSRVPWEGGPSYYSQFSTTANTEWTTASFFPIMYWGAYVDSEAKIQKDADLGINVFGEMYNPTAATAGWMSTHGVWNLGYEPTTGTGGTEWIGHFLPDEADMWAGLGAGQWNDGVYGFVPNVCNPDGSGCAQDMFITLEAARSSSDGRLRYYNGGKSMLMWDYSPATGAYVNGDGWPVGLATGDLYFYSDANLYLGESVTWLGIPQAQARRAANYGEVIMTRLRVLDGLVGSRKPLGAIVELGQQSTANSGDAHYAPMTPDKIEGAVWSTIVHEARLVSYFSHAFGTEQGTSDALNESGVYYTSVQTRVGAVNAKIQSLATVLNTQSYRHTFNASLSTMLKKGPDGAGYVFAMLKRASATGSYSFTLPADIPVSNVEVVGESRSITPSGGAFTDSFAAEYTHHVYKLVP